MKSKTDVGVILGLTLAGILSGLLTIAAPRILALVGLSDAFSFIGGVFGLVVAGYFWVFRGIRSISAVLGFVLISALAFYAAIMVTRFIPYHLTFLDFSGGKNDEIRTDLFFTSGCLGAIIVFVAFFVFLLPERKPDRLLFKSISLSLFGGVLGVSGWVLGPTFGKALWFVFKTLHLGEPAQSAHPHPSGDEEYFYSLFVVWQSGIAFVMGVLASFVPSTATVLVPVEPSGLGAAPHRQEDLRWARRLILWSGIIVLAYVGFLQFRSHRMQIRRQQDYAKSQAEAPSLTNLSPLEPMSLERILVLRPIDGYVPVRPFLLEAANPATQRGNPPALHYYVNYMGATEQTSLTAIPMVRVNVMQFGSPEWAKYELRNVPMPNAAIDYASTRRNVSKFGNAIVMDSGWRNAGQQYYYWPSGNFIIVLVCNTSINDEEFLREYLNQHPSSL